MFSNRTWHLIRKEWTEIFKNKMVLFIAIFLPLLFAVMPLIILNGMGDAVSGVEMDAALSDVPQEFAKLCGGLQGMECAQFFIITQFLALFLMIPLMIPITIASYSIVGEKRTRTLEPLLATPISTIELLAGKALAAIIPALLATFAAYLIFVVGTILLIGNPAVTAKLFSPLWLLAIFGVGPLLALAGVSLAVMVSSRVNDPRAAEQISSLIILPVLGLFVSQSIGLFQLNEVIMIWIALGFIILDAGLLYFAVQLFQRETILTRWK